ncbi:MAG: SRPBCC family protein [Acidimicrobiia bacterium]
MTISHNIKINAPITRVWTITTDIDRLPEVTPTIERVARLTPGELAEGDQFKLWQPDLMAAVWTVTEVDPKRYVFSWKRKLGLSTLTATHELKREKKGCSSALSLDVTGLGSGLVERAMRSRAERSLESENQAIKAAAES